MNYFINDYSEPLFKKVNNHNCKVKETIKLVALKPTKKSLLLSGIIRVKNTFKRWLKIPHRRSIIRISNHEAGEKSLKANILTEIKYFKGKQSIKVYTDIANQFNQPIKNY